MNQQRIQELDFPSELWLPFAQNRAVVRCHTGHLIYLQESHASCFYFLKSGRVKSFIQAEDGNQRVLQIYHPGSLFGEASFFDELPRVSSAMAMEPCEVVSIDKDLVAQEFAKDPKLALTMLKYLARTVRILSRQVDDMAFHPAPQRLARYLLEQMEENGSIHSTQEEIASSISTSRVTVSRVLKQWEQQTWLELSYGKIKIKQPEKLGEL